MRRACLIWISPPHSDAASENGDRLRFYTIIIGEMTIKCYKILPHFHLLKIKHLGFDFSGRIFNADGAYDMEYIFEYIFWMGMFPNIKQRKGSTNHKTPKRKKAAERFNLAEYEKRRLIEGIFGAEETRRYQLHCRFVLDKNRILFAKGRAIAWNIRVLNRFECANRLHIPIPSYCGVAHTVCA